MLSEPVTIEKSVQRKPVAKKISNTSFKEVNEATNKMRSL